MDDLDSGNDLDKRGGSMFIADCFLCLTTRCQSLKRWYTLPGHSVRRSCAILTAARPFGIFWFLPGGCAVARAHGQRREKVRLVCSADRHTAPEKHTPIGSLIYRIRKSGWFRVGKKGRKQGLILRKGDWQLGGGDRMGEDYL